MSGSAAMVTPATWRGSGLMVGGAGPTVRGRVPTRGGDASALSKLETTGYPAVETLVRAPGGGQRWWSR